MGEERLLVAGERGSPGSLRAEAWEKLEGVRGQGRGLWRSQPL